MKKVGPVLSILFSLFQLYAVFVQLSAGVTTKNTTQAVQVDYTTASLVSLILIVALASGVAGLMHKKWAKKVGIGAWIVWAILQIMQGNIVATVLAGIVAGSLFFAE